MESLEDRRLMASVPYTDGKYYPQIGKYTGFLPSDLSPAEYARRADLTSGFVGSSGSTSSGEGISAEGAGGGAFTAIEIENNDLLSRAQVLPLGTEAGKYQIVNLTGTSSNSLNQYDEDYYAIDLRKGDIFDVSLRALFPTSTCR